MTTMLKEPTTKKSNILLPSWGFVPAGSDQALKRLCRAVIIQAMKDAAGTCVISPMNQFDAVDWLAGNEAADYCEFSGIDHRAVIAWLFDGAPYPEKTTTKGLTE